MEGKLLEISSINDGIGEVVIHGQIMSTEERELRNGKIILTGYITDFHRHHRLQDVLQS